MYRICIGTLRRGLLLALFVGDLRALTRLGLRIKHMRAHGRLVWDSSLRHYLQARARPLQGPLNIISYAERAVPLIDLLIWLRLRRQQPRKARFFGLAVGGAAMLRWLSKTLVRRPRPSLAQRLGWSETSSFPSGHSTDCLALVLALVAVTRQSYWQGPIRLFGMVIALLMGLSRIIRNRHYPSDVLAGWGLALVWVQQMRMVLRPGVALLRRERRGHRAEVPHVQICGWHIRRACSVGRMIIDTGRADSSARTTGRGRA